jgi:hypothetical protein
MRTSERAGLRRCFWQHGLVWEQGWRPNRPKTALWLGTGIHIALAKFYCYPGFDRGPHPADTFEAWAENEVRATWYQEDADDERIKSGDAVQMGIDMLEQYIEFYGDDTDLEILAREQDFQVLIPALAGSHKGEPYVEYDGTWDGAIRFRKSRQVAVFEHKTTTGIGNRDLALDDQAGSYLLVAYEVLREMGAINSREEIAGIYYNFLRKAFRDERPQDADGLRLNKDGTVSKRQPEKLFMRHMEVRFPQEHNNQMKRIVQEAWLRNELRAGRIPRIKNTITLPGPNACKSCPVYEVCRAHEQGGDWRALLEAGYHQEDPYAAHVAKEA